jgi:hypothetical protein
VLHNFIALLLPQLKSSPEHIYIVGFIEYEHSLINVTGVKSTTTFVDKIVYCHLVALLQYCFYGFNYKYTDESNLSK